MEMATRIDIGFVQTAAKGHALKRPLHSSQLGFGRILDIASAEWLALAAVWAGSVIMNEQVGGDGYGIADLALGVDRALLGLVICVVLIPRLLERGSNLLFLVAAVGVIAGFTALHIIVIAPLIESQDVHYLDCFRCYLNHNLPAVATMAVIKLSWSFLDQQKQAAIVGRANADAELSFLRAQMNPHLLFNSLNNVYSYALEKSDLAPAMILKLSGVLRYMLYEAAGERVQLQRELDYIRDYFELQRLATEGRGDVNLTIAGDPVGYEIAPLLLIVFVENCFKHAADTAERMQVAVAIRIADGMLSLETTNNLPTPPQNSGRSRPGGIGLENVRRRLNLLYPGHFTLEALPDGDCFRARLRLALDKV